LRVEVLASHRAGIAEAGQVIGFAEEDVATLAGFGLQDGGADETEMTAYLDGAFGRLLVVARVAEGPERSRGECEHQERAAGCYRDLPVESPHRATQPSPAMKG
jgi:hypothetical protein